MKDIIAISIALSTAAASASVSRASVLDAMKAANNDPEVLATHLLQYGEALDTRAANDCAGLTGYEHCTKCAMPSIQNLVTSLVAVKTEVWTDQKAIADQASSVCNSASPADRFGGNAKCCAAVTTASLYAPAGYAACTAATFDAASATPVALAVGTEGAADPTSNVKYNRDHGFYFHASGDVKPSSMIQDCCVASSTCRTNEGALSADVAAAIADLNTAKEGIESDIAQKKATVLEATLEQSKLDHANTQLKKICSASVDADFTDASQHGSVELPDADDTEASEIIAKCPGDCQIKTISLATEARVGKITAHIAAVEKTKDIIVQVIDWLKADSDGDGSAHIFTGARHAHERDENGKLTTSLALLESASKQTTSTDALAALSKATSLLQGVGRDNDTSGSGISKVLELLRQIETDFDNQIEKLETYKDNQYDEEKTDLLNLRDQIVLHEAERTAAIIREAAIQTKLSDFGTAMTAKHVLVTSKMLEWRTAYNSREANVRKCNSFMTFFDAETLINTEELLILKKAIDIIKHISCGTSQAPTPSPDTPAIQPIIETLEPTKSPTLFPTRSPTASPTAPPSDAALANDVACGAGSYRFLAKVYSDPARFSVPSYTDGIQYTLAEGAAGTCQTSTTTHTTDEGIVQTVEHQYKCCGGNGDVAGSYYGAISYDKTANSLCEADVTDHCSLFGANMYTGNAEPAAAPAQGTFAPTAEPTGYPTRDEPSTTTSSSGQGGGAGPPTKIAWNIAGQRSDDKLDSKTCTSTYSTVPADECLAAAVAEFGDKVTASRSNLVTYDGTDMPYGCSVQGGTPDKAGDWCAHFNSVKGLDANGVSNADASNLGKMWRGYTAITTGAMVSNPCITFDASSDTLTRTNGLFGWNAGAFGSDGIAQSTEVHGFSFQVDFQQHGITHIGLGSDKFDGSWYCGAYESISADLNHYARASYDIYSGHISYCNWPITLYPSSDGSMRVAESGSSKASFGLGDQHENPSNNAFNEAATSSDVFSIQVYGGKLEVLRNGSVFYTNLNWGTENSATVTYPLYPAVTLYQSWGDQSSRIWDAKNF